MLGKFAMPRWIKDFVPEQVKRHFFPVNKHLEYNSLNSKEIIGIDKKVR